MRIEKMKTVAPKLKEVVPLNRRIRLEKETQDGWVARNLANFQMLKRAYPRMFQLLEVGKTHVRVQKPDFHQIRDLYWKLSECLNKQQPQAQQTRAERLHLKSLAALTCKKITPSLWVGKGCVDLFIPNIKAVKLNKNKPCGVGLVIEIDGGVHNLETKIIKDESKGRQLDILKIMTLSQKNWDVRSRPFIGLGLYLKNLPVPSSRERKRMWTKIYMFTLACHMPQDKFEKLLGLKK